MLSPESKVTQGRYWKITPKLLGGLGLVGGLDGLVDGWVVGDNARPMQN